MLDNIGNTSGYFNGRNSCSKRPVILMGDPDVLFHDRYRLRGYLVSNLRGINSLNIA